MEIKIKGARVHNLKNIDLSIPHNKLVVITGLSGSGKSTLAFDTIFAEGQRRYVESLSSYARQFLGKIEKPDVDSITGIAPAIAVEQKVNTRNPRSTVGTSTEIYEYLRLLFARIGKTYSPISGNEVKADTIDDVVAWIYKNPVGSRIMITAPIILSDNQGLIEKLTLLLRDGFQRITINGELSEIEAAITSIDGSEKISILVDRIVVESEQDPRVFDSVQRAFSLGSGECIISIVDGVEHSFSNRFECDGMTFDRPFEHLFSFNNPLGACPKCEGYGKIVGIDENLVIPDKSKTLFQDAILAWRGDTMKDWKKSLLTAAKESNIPIHTPYYELSKAQKQLLWTGNKHFEGLNAFFAFLDKERYKIQNRFMLARYTGKSICPDCEGGRLRKEAQYVRVNGKSIVELTNMPISDLQSIFANLELDEHDRTMSSRILIEITNRIQYLLDVGLGYLTIDRQSSTLSGGESQRINLATSLGSSLVGSLYILDEPSIGLHPRDTQRLIGVLKQLRDLGNTVIVVEHEEEVIRAADVLIDIGPHAGLFGGEVIYNGPVNELLYCNSKDKASQLEHQQVIDRSLTAQYLLGIREIALPTKHRKFLNSISINGARQNNLKNISVSIPLGVMTCITGVSGSGKSSLVGDILHPAIYRRLMETGNRPGDFDSLSGDVEKITAIELVDQNPIGKSLRSNAVTYIKAYDDIRKLYSDEKLARQRGYEPSNFSFNIAGGRCEECKGEGIIRVSMQFMADVEMVCEHCNGQRFKDPILDVTYHKKNIFQVLEMSVDEAVDFFAAENQRINIRITEKLKVLQDVGLGYIKLGQSSSTLSGGESQRVKLASFLLKENNSGHIMFIFDEPTTGLHFHDIDKLLKSFNALVSKGHTIVVVEHNMDVIKCADWVIDLGLEGGEKGGNLIFQGIPEKLASTKYSYTAEALKSKFKKRT